MCGVRWEGVLSAPPLWLVHSRRKVFAALAGLGVWVERLGVSPGKAVNGLRCFGIEPKRCGGEYPFPPHSKQRSLNGSPPHGRRSRRVKGRYACGWAVVASTQAR